MKEREKKNHRQTHLGYPWFSLQSVLRTSLFLFVMFNVYIGLYDKRFFRGGILRDEFEIIFSARREKEVG